MAQPALKVSESQSARVPVGSLVKTVQITARPYPVLERVEGNGFYRRLEGRCRVFLNDSLQAGRYKLKVNVKTRYTVEDNPTDEELISEVEHLIHDVIVPKINAGDYKLIFCEAKRINASRVEKYRVQDDYFELKLTPSYADITLIP